MKKPKLDSPTETTTTNDNNDINNNSHNNNNNNQNKRKKKKKHQPKRNNEWKQDSSNMWVQVRERSNTLLEKYYDLQFKDTIPNWVDGGERETFFTSLKTPLPQTFRISEAIEPSVHDQIRSRIENEFVPDIASVLIEEEVEDVNLAAAAASAESEKTDDATSAATAAAAAVGQVEEEQGEEKSEKKQRIMTKITKKVDPPRPISWYPNNTGTETCTKFETRNSAWHFGVSKALLRKNTTLAKFRSFLMSQTERGNISRQEEVSMIPPMFFFSGMTPEDRVLDMCAAPGSKTAQLVEMLYASSRKYKRPISGYVVGNDNDVKRAYLLVHQMQRLSNIFPNVIITNHDATQYPLLKVNGQKQKFTKILCDVMCTGDGTLRKSPDLWKRWKPNLAWALHDLQIKCVTRAFEIIEVGGTIVYSTCSLNPIEDEAVVAEIIRQTNYQLELVDASKELPNLNYSPGMKHWYVTNSKSEAVTLEQYEEFFKLPVEEQERYKEKLSPKITRSMFPPTEEEAAKMNLHYGMRLLPNRMDTGGFFVAVFKKVGDASLSSNTPATPTPTETVTTTTATDAMEDDVVVAATDDSEEKAPKELIRKYKGKATQNEQFIPANEKVLERVYNHYSIDKTIIPPEQMIIRVSETAQESGHTTIDTITEDDIKKIYYVSKGIRDIIAANATQNKWKIINLGVRMFERKKQTDFMPKECPFRFTQDFADQFAHAVGRERIIRLHKEDFITFLKQLTTMTDDIKDQEVREQIKRIGGGSVIVEYVPEEKNETTSGIYIAALKTQNNLMRHCSREHVRAIVYRVDPTLELEEHDKPNIPKQKKNKQLKRKLAQQQKAAASEQEGTAAPATEAQTTAAE